MATYTVTTTSDLVDPGDGQLSLREALALADANPGTADTIDFVTAVQGGRIVLAGSQLTVNSDVTVDGGSGVTIDADGKSRVLLVQAGTQSDPNEVTLAHLIVTGGRTVGDYESGGGIRAEGDTALTLDHAVVSGNSTAGFGAGGGGIVGFSYVTLADATVSGNSTGGAYASGGGIQGNLVTLTSSTVSGNSAAGDDAAGGGISGSNVTLTESTVSGNSTADGSGGGIFSGRFLTLTDSTVSGNATAGDGAEGGGIRGYYVTVADSTVSGNSTGGDDASGGGIYAYRSMTLTSSTVSGNSTAGVASDGGGVIARDVTLANSIVAGNTTDSGAGPDVDGSVLSNGLNVFGSTVDGSVPSDRENVATDLVFAALDPVTGGGLLADNGGPTQTIALRDAPDNPALGRADPEISPATDQRGEARPQPAGTAPDIGAFELDQSDPTPPPVGATFVVTTTSDVSADDGQLTLREALALADADSLSKDRIEFAAEVQGQTITLAGSQLTANSDITVDGGAGVVIDANQASRVLLIGGLETDVTLQHLTIAGGRTTGGQDYGGGIRAGQTTRLTLDHTTVTGNSTDADGGGISGDFVTLTNSTVSGNSAGRGGGVSGRNVTLTDSTVCRNSAADGGAGGIYGRYATLTGSTISDNNTTGGGGGGISGQTMTLVNCTVSGNSAAEGWGGGIRSDNILTLTDSTVSGNSAADGLGGGIGGNLVTLTSSTVSGNSTADGSGGGIFGASVTLTNSTVSGNSLAGDDSYGGGGIAGSNVTLTNSAVTGNSTAGVGVDGGGIFGSDVTLANSIVAGNTTVGGAGPDVYASVYGSILSNGLNVFGSAVDGSLPSDRENVSVDLVFAALDPVTGGGLLADNGGPTQTIALRDAPDNPALGRAGPEIAPGIDQRGEARPQPAGTAPDIGAFELDQSDPAPPPVGTTFVVTTTSDVSVDDGQLTLREALALADADSLTADRIEFAAEVQGQTITLAGSQLTASSDITVDGGAGVTVDANQASRVLLIEGLGTEVTLQHLTITGGRTTADHDGGGGIRAGQTTRLTLDYTTVSGNSTAGYRATGGGISGDSVALTNSTVSGNSTGGYGAYGGGIRGHAVMLLNSTVRDNSTAGEHASGGGIEGYSVTLTSSTVSGNSTADYGASGGGISGEKIAVTNSSVSNNSTAGDSAGGAGIFAHGFPAAVILTNSTVAGNRARGEYADGGGIFVNEYGALALTDSTVTGNTAGVYGYGGGLFLFETPYSRASATVRNSIVAGNFGGGGPADPDIAGRITTSNGHNIFGSNVLGAIGGDLEDVPASLLFAGGLADNGGPTQTIALRDAADNPALAGADPADSPATDQRGEARPQPEGTAPDIGAFELNQEAVAYNPVTGTDSGEFLSGTSHADLMRGLGGDDRLWGRPGDDLLFGDAGKDMLAGKEGVDQMTGGDDADRFLYRRPVDAPPDGPVLDQIMDFRRAQHDMIDLRPIDADQTAVGNQTFTFIGEQQFTRAGQVRYEEVAGGQFRVSGSTDRDPAPEFAFLVHSAEQLEAADFLL